MSDPVTTSETGAYEFERALGRLRLLEARLADVTATTRRTELERDTALERVRQLESALVHAAAARDAEVRHAEALARHVQVLQRRVDDLLSSRRWQAGKRVGDVTDAVLRRRRAIGEDDRLRDLMVTGRDLAGALVEDRARRRADRGRLDAPATAGLARRDCGAYLRTAVIDPVLHETEDPGGRHVLDVMAGWRDRLARRWAGRADGPLVTVVMPTYNRRALLPRAIGSVLAQSYQRWELVVVDDGSTDGTGDLVRGYRDERVVYVGLEANRGVSYARNRGLERARGTLVAYLDSDNYWHEHYLLLMTGVLGEHAGREAAYCAQEIWEVGAGDPAGNGDATAAGDPGDGEVPGDGVRAAASRRLDGVRFAPFNRALLENRNYIDLNAFVHARSLYERLGGFDEELPRLVDWDLVLRYTAERRPVALPCVLSHYEFGTASNQLTRSLPVRPATRQIDKRTLWLEVLDDALDPDRAERYGHPTLFAPPGERRGGTPRPVTVVVTGAGDGDRLARCLDLVRAGAAGADLDFVVVDAAGDVRSRAAVARVAAAADVAALRVEGADAAAALRAGVEAADASRDVLLLDAAAVVVPGWLEALWEVLDTAPDAGLVVPRVVLLPGMPGYPEHVPYAKDYRELDVSLSLRHGNVLDPWLDDERGFVELTWAPLACAYLARGALDAAGPPPGAGDAAGVARVYGDLLRSLAGLRVVYTPHAKVYHLP